MNYIFTIFSLLFLFSSMVSFAVAVIAWKRKRERGTKELAWLMFFAGLWSFFVIFETASPTLELKIFWSKVAYVGALTTPVLYLTLVLRFVGKDKYLKLKYQIALWTVPFITFILTLTNEYHGLIWTGYAPISPSTNLTQYYHGIAFWIGNVMYNYILLIITSAYLLTFIFKRMLTFRTQGLYLFVASLCPWVASVFYITAKNPVPGLDLVPQSMIFSGILFTIAIFKNRFLDLSPVARETLFETLGEGIIVLDTNNRVQDINDTARGFLGVDS
ncbi:MAG: histidine kinase N-terminal 7TM domain-containing protein, partial [Bacteroidales bacterium]|nr:histidine kinase N-terminal 7TM domain-containing protein [Bacteroidales bacterium]